MERLLMFVLNCFCWSIPFALAWSFMSYHKYSLFGVVVGCGMGLFLAGVLFSGRSDDKKHK